jgi:hypothetical protein
MRHPMAGWFVPQLSTAARLVSFNLLPAHGWLAPAIVSHLSQHGRHVTELIKNMLSKLRGLYPQGMWEVYLNALKMGFERHRAAGEQGLDSFKELSAKIALSFGGHLLGCARSSPDTLSLPPGSRALKLLPENERVAPKMRERRQQECRTLPKALWCIRLHWTPC